MKILQLFLIIFILIPFSGCALMRAHFVGETETKTINFIGDGDDHLKVEMIQGQKSKKLGKIPNDLEITIDEIIAGEEENYTFVISKKGYKPAHVNINFQYEWYEKIPLFGVDCILSTVTLALAPTGIGAGLMKYYATGLYRKYGNRDEDLNVICIPNKETKEINTFVRCSYAYINAFNPDYPSNISMGTSTARTKHLSYSEIRFLASTTYFSNFELYMNLFLSVEREQYEIKWMIEELKSRKYRTYPIPIELLNKLKN